jgi:2-polyprenyl-3-methyl-5-hydroxy-6-metoxy-1,4-benzoquinol methylase
MSERTETPGDPSERERIRASWESNAGAWTDAVRNGRIPSRRLATDVAIVSACERELGARASARALDVGCGEGWLTRRLASPSVRAVGIDASAALIDAARRTPSAAGDVAPQYEVVAYEDLRRDVSRVAGPFDLIVCNYALLDDALASTLAALRARLEPDGALVIQTVHPWVAAGDGAYEDGWRVETFSAFEQPFPSTMPWYFRTLESWLRDIHAAGLELSRLEEPRHPETQRPLSLVITARHAVE